MKTLPGPSLSPQLPRALVVAGRRRSFCGNTRRRIGRITPMTMITFHGGSTDAIAQHSLYATD